jgi:serine/threonine-protein kinase
LEPLHKKKQKKKLSLFLATAALSLLFSVCGVFLGISANAKASDTYEQKLYEASISADYEDKVKLYQECIAIPHKAGETDAYLGLIKSFKENDTYFTVEEAGLLEKLIKNNKSALQENPSVYTEVCFETGKLFWYYYNYGDGSDNQVTRAKSAIPWFRDVLDNAPDGYENLGMARVYSNIGIFYRDITTNITEASDKGQYKPLFDNLQELLSTVAADESEKEIVRLEMLEMARSAIQQYATKFKLDDVPRESLSEMHRSISAMVRSINTTTDTTTNKKNNTITLLPDTLRAIDSAYGTNKGG